MQKQNLLYCLKNPGEYVCHSTSARRILKTISLVCLFTQADASEIYTNRFIEIQDEINDPDNGYFSADGGPYHSVETFIIEAPDHGHESTSEAYSYMLWMAVLNGKLTGDWQALVDAWDTIEEHIIPTSEMQPTADGYNPSSPATYVPEGPLPSSYPLPLTTSAATGIDPISSALAQQYGTWEVYGMHWLLDMDNVYGYGNFGDGVSTPSYINTFQRGEEESVFETVPHPSWEDFTWGGDYGFLDLFVEEGQAPAKQWRYTNAPDADARVVQLMYWALQWMEEQGVDPETVTPGLMGKASKMGDYLRLAMFDKYFKQMGAQSESGGAGTGYDSAHYLMSWYYAWGGPLVSQGWAWRIGCSHVHFAYQNPVAAYALSQVSELIPATPGAQEDWNTSLERSLEFLQWLQTDEGAFSGGATNSWNGSYDTYPNDATFYGMVYDDNPVYHDPGSGTWFGWQTWLTERLAEYYYITGESQAKALLDKWVDWVLDQSPATGLPVLDLSNDDVTLATTLSFSGLPEPWDSSDPQENTDLHVEVTVHNQDAGAAHSLAKALMYYAAAEEVHQGTVHAESRDAAQLILDRFWNNHRTSLGVSAVETRGDFTRLFDEVYFPSGWTGTNGTGATFGEGSTFLDMRPFYLTDPGYDELVNAMAEDRDPEYVIHRYWAQVEVATANALFAILFPNICEENCPPVAQSKEVRVEMNTATTIILSGTDSNGEIVLYEYTQPANGSVSGYGPDVTYTPDTDFVGEDSFTFTVTDDEDLTSESATISITVFDPLANEAPVAAFTATPASGDAPLTVTFDASESTDPDEDSLTYSWDFGDGSTATGVTTDHTYDEADSYVVTLVVDDGALTDTATLTVVVNEPSLPCDDPVAISVPFIYNGAGEYCWSTSDDISIINCWNLEELTINGVDYTDTWSDSMPEKIDGKFYIHYQGSYPWSHLEIH
jgi:PKD repeat protein